MNNYNSITESIRIFSSVILRFGEQLSIKGNISIIARNLAKDVRQQNAFFRLKKRLLGHIDSC